MKVNLTRSELSQLADMLSMDTSDNGTEYYETEEDEALANKLRKAMRL